MCWCKCDLDVSFPQDDHAQHTVHFIVFLYFSCKPPDFIALIDALINLIN